MIATARGLAVLAALAAVLLVLALVVGPRRPAAIDRSLMPGFDDKRVNELVFTRDGKSIRISRGGGNQWRWQDPPGVAEPSAIDAVFTALRGGRWHRRAKIGAAGPARAQLTVGTTTLSVHDTLPGTEQTWIVRGHDALLVDSWIAHALAPEPLALRMRHPIDCASASSIVISYGAAATIEGTRLLEPKQLWIDKGWLDRLYAACARIEIVELRTEPLQKVPGIQIAAGGELAQVGTCEGPRSYVDTSSGSGCVEADSLRMLYDLLREITGQPQLAIDRRPVPIAPKELTLLELPGGKLLDLRGGPRIGTSDADPDRVRELIAALTARTDFVVHPINPARSRIVATARDGTKVTLELWDHIVARDGEPGALELPDDAWKIITRPTTALLDATRWREDATTLSSLVLDDVTYRRGAVLGEWTRDPAAAFDEKLIDALVETLATLRAPTTAAPTEIAHRLRITFDPPVGQPVMHTLDVGPPTERGCSAVVDKAPVMLPLPLCTAVVALASSR